jgi:integrase
MRSTQRITVTLVERLKAPTASGQQEIVWDSDLKGFGVLLSGVSNAKTYIVRITIKGQPKRPRLTLGRTNVITFDQARQLARAHIKAGGDGIDPRIAEQQLTAQATTLQQVLDKHLADCRARNALKQTSLDKLEDNITKHLKGWLELPLRSITRDMVAKRHAEIPAEIANGKKKGYSGTTQANQVMRAFRRVFNVASVDNDQLQRNPVEVLTLKKLWYPETQRDDHVPPRSLLKFWLALDALPNQIHADLIKFMVLTGLREGNARTLQWSQVDFRARTIRFERTQMKSKRVHELPLSDYLLIHLERRRALGNAVWVWPANSKTGHVMEFRKAVNACAKAAEIEKLTIHGLRRTFSTLARRVVAKDDVSRLVDHAQDSITDRYIISSVDSLRAPMQRVTDEILLLAGVNITDPNKMPKSLDALMAAYVRRFGGMTFTTFGMCSTRIDSFMREGLERMSAITDDELIERGEMPDYRDGNIVLAAQAA